MKKQRWVMLGPGEYDARRIEGWIMQPPSGNTPRTKVYFRGKLGWIIVELDAEAVSRIIRDALAA